MLLILSGCGSGKSVGSDEILDFEEQEESRLGAASPSPESADNPGSAPVAEPPPPPQAAQPKPAESQTFFDVTLIPNHPYFEPGDEIVISAGTTLRVTNKDTTSERPERSFTADDGSFDSGMLKLGQSWTFKFDSPGSWRIVDRSAPFISARLDVR